MTHNVDQETLGKYLLRFFIVECLMLGRMNRLGTDLNLYKQELSKSINSKSSI